MAESLLNSYVLVVKGHHLSLAIGNLTCSIRRTECLRQLAAPRGLLSANRSIETWFATVSGQNKAGLKASQLHRAQESVNVLTCF